ncbi:glycosyltransferase [Pelagibacterium halotolerans]|uniref:UDP-glucose:sterol glucosyltransferase n=1 Tax=Pelagibacterium halotolerans (strain DSM 22347 / JCM 15775 / CGMCC 1.7692 / B2) TaxID=1082931 RepID=G4R6J4_PELHB|nr:nucleotide disphospho-sugar-binding domain-containing protein [Pelagibacterium halotolerans]AEQ51190.1 UDP-glucose:sterol glucosyltransferase [Pelagibacterium halotolerans B2]QJR18945.1 glycosyltransferase family 1 protein [Pelagibacterium halotolerans]SEA68715.1 UDP:flavonoid glycosyltransferase YjiC, YdhE family [Pelagibacterium halotolerans]
MTKRIAMATLGTQGDVQPYVALARAMIAQGYSVVIGTTDDFESMVTGYGIEFWSLGPSMQEFVKQSQFERAMNQNLLVNAPALLRQGQKIVDRAARSAWDMAQGADCIMLNMNTSFSIDIAEALDIPAIVAALQPLNSTSEFPLCIYYGPTFGKTINRLTYSTMTVQQIYYNLPRNKLRRELMGLGPRKNGGFFKDTDGTPLWTLNAYSEIISPRPRDWPKTSIVTGYWMLPDNSGWQPSEEFKTFLDKGPLPIYVGFGSMPWGADRNTDILREALTMWNGRVVVGRGWGGIKPDDLPADRVYVIDRAPHDQLFKYVKAVVHHGGAGTTASGLMLGKPTFIVPQMVDQPYWGGRVHEMGCGPKPVRRRKLTAEALADALSQLDSNPGFARNAEKIGEQLRAEDGTGKAIKVIERVMANYQPRSERKLA